MTTADGIYSSLRAVDLPCPAVSPQLVTGPCWLVSKLSETIKRIKKREREREKLQGKDVICDDGCYL